MGLVTQAARVMSALICAGMSQKISAPSRWLQLNVHIPLENGRVYDLVLAKNPSLLSNPAIDPAITPENSTDLID